MPYLGEKMVSDESPSCESDNSVNDNASDGPEDIYKEKHNFAFILDQQHASGASINDGNNYGS